MPFLQRTASGVLTLATLSFSLGVIYVLANVIR